MYADVLRELSKNIVSVGRGLECLPQQYTIEGKELSK